MVTHSIIFQGSLQFEYTHRNILSTIKYRTSMKKIKVKLNQKTLCNAEPARHDYFVWFKDYQQMPTMEYVMTKVAILDRIAYEHLKV